MTRSSRPANGDGGGDSADEETATSAAARFWEDLTRAASARGDPLRWPVVATVRRAPDGSARPAARIMVLRGVDPAACQLVFHTDARAGKISDIAAHPYAAATFFDPARQRQFRVEGPAALATEPETDAAWAALGADARRAYGAEPPPGSPLTSVGTEAPGAPPSAEPGIADVARRRGFALFRLTAQSVDILDLAPTQRRRRLAFSAGAAPQLTALRP